MKTMAVWVSARLIAYNFSELYLDFVVVGTSCSMVDREVILQIMCTSVLKCVVTFKFAFPIAIANMFLYEAQDTHIQGEVRLLQINSHPAPNINNNEFSYETCGRDSFIRKALLIARFINEKLYYLHICPHYCILIQHT